jgi:chromosomal replication initiation ATPase DnaA
VKYSKQLPFDFECRPSLGGEDFLVAPSNHEAVAWLDNWSNWPSPLFILYGPPGCGKTHLSNVFIASTGALCLTPTIIKTSNFSSLLDSQKFFVVDDNRVNTFVNFSEISLFHFYNNLVTRGGHLLVTAESHPINWEFKLADLSSRVKAAQAIGIGMPEDDLIKVVLVKLFSDRQVRVETNVIEYVTKRIGRSFDEARKFVECANEIALVEKKGITLAVARQVFSDLKL